VAQAFDLAGITNTTWAYGPIWRSFVNGRQQGRKTRHLIRVISQGFADTRLQTAELSEATQTPTASLRELLSHPDGSRFLPLIS